MGRIARGGDECGECGLWFLWAALPLGALMLGRWMARDQAGWRVAICWLITADTPSPRIVTP
jgi:hypothetical protein